MITCANYHCLLQYQLFRLLFKINAIDFSDTGLIFTSEVFTLCKDIWGPRGPGTANFDMLIPFLKLYKEGTYKLLWGKLLIKAN